MILDSGTSFWILWMFLDCGKCFWNLGRVLDSGKCFLDSRKYFVLTSHRRFICMAG